MGSRTCSSTRAACTPDAVKHAVLERQPVRIRHQQRVGRREDVGPDQLERVIRVEFVRAIANRTSADNEHDRPFDSSLQEFDEACTVRLRHLIAAEGELMEA